MEFWLRVQEQWSRLADDLDHSEGDRDE
jgi:hypothetical protein